MFQGYHEGIMKQCFSWKKITHKSTIQTQTYLRLVEMGTAFLNEHNFRERTE